MAYAEETKVPIGRTRDEIDSLIQKHGGDTVGIVTAGDRVVLTWHAAGRWVRFTVPLLEQRTKEQTAQYQRARWRALLLVVKGKLESVATGIESFEQAFLAETVLPDGSTVHESTHRTIARAYDSGAVSPLLELGS